MCSCRTGTPFLYAQKKGKEAPKGNPYAFVPQGTLIRHCGKNSRAASAATPQRTRCAAKFAEESLPTRFAAGDDLLHSANKGLGGRSHIRWEAAAGAGVRSSAKGRGRRAAESARGSVARKRMSARAEIYTNIIIRRFAPQYNLHFEEAARGGDKQGLPGQILTMLAGRLRETPHLHAGVRRGWFVTFGGWARAV